MKGILLTFFLLNSILYAQDSLQSNSKLPNTKLGRINLTAGTIIKKKFEDIGKIVGYKPDLWKYQPGLSDLTIKFISIQDAANGLTVGGYIFSSTSNPDNKIYLDFDEVPGMLSFVNFVSQKIKQPIEPDTEYHYQFRDFKMICYEQENRKREREWQVILKFVVPYSSGITLLNNYQFNFNADTLKAFHDIIVADMESRGASLLKDTKDYMLSGKP